MTIELTPAKISLIAGGIALVAGITKFVGRYLQIKAAEQEMRTRWSEKMARISHLKW